MNARSSNSPRLRNRARPRRALIRRRFAYTARRSACLFRHRIGALDAAEFIENRPGTRTQPGLALPLLQSFPEDVGKEANQDVRLDAIGSLMPDGTQGQLAFVDSEGRFRLGQLGIGLPERLGSPVRDVGAQNIAAFTVPGPLIPGGVHRPLQTESGGA